MFLKCCQKIQKNLSLRLVCKRRGYLALHTIWENSEKWEDNNSRLGWNEFSKCHVFSIPNSTLIEEMRGTLEVCFTKCNAWSSSNSKKKLSNISANCLTFRHIWLSRRWNANTSVENCFFNLAVVDFFVIMRWDIFCYLAKWIQYAHYSKMSSSSNSP